MKSAIRDIFHGFKGHMETMHMPEELLIIDREKLQHAQDAFMTKVSPELLKLHQNYVEILENHYSEEIDFYFAEGFKLGLLIGIECAE